MRLNYHRGVGPECVSANNTPSAAARRLPFYTTDTGGFLPSGQDLFLPEREGMEDSHLLFYTLRGRGTLNTAARSGT